MEAIIRIQCQLRKFLHTRRVALLRERRDFNDRVSAAEEAEGFAAIRAESVRLLQRNWRMAIARRFVRNGIAQREAVIRHVESSEEPALFRAANVGLDSFLPVQLGALADVQTYAFGFGHTTALPYLNMLGACTVDAEAFERALLLVHWELPAGLSYLLTCRDPSKSYPGIDQLIHSRDYVWSGEAQTPTGEREETAPPPPVFSPTVVTETAVAAYHVPKSLNEREQRLQMLRRLIVLKKVTRIQRWWRRVFYARRKERYERVVKHLSVFNECASRIQMWWRNGCSTQGMENSKEMLAERLLVMVDRLKQEQLRVERAQKQENLRHLWFTMTKHPAAAAAKLDKSMMSSTQSSRGAKLPPVKMVARLASTSQMQRAPAPTGRYLRDSTWNSRTLPLKELSVRRKETDNESVVPFALLWRERYWPVRRAPGIRSHGSLQKLRHHQEEEHML